MKINLPNRVAPVFTAEGARAARIGPEKTLRRLTTTTLLWEDGFYVDGKTVADQIKELIPLCRTEFVAACAYEARTVMKLRHLPLLVVREMARHPEHKAVVAKLLPDIIQRADEITEFMAIYWKDGRQPVSAQVKLGLRAAFAKFNEYQLAKYDRKGAVKLRDVAFLAHVKPWDETPGESVGKERTYKGKGGTTEGAGQAMLLRHPDSLLGRLIDDKLDTANTWETRMSGGESATSTFKDLMAKKELGGLAFLRNIRKMSESRITIQEMSEYSKIANFSKVLPFRFVAAARALPQAEQFLEPAMLKACEDQEKLKGNTIILVDVSASMDAAISSKSDLQRSDAAAALAALVREICDNVAVITFSNKAVVVPPRRGFALMDAIKTSQHHGGTNLFSTVDAVNRETEKLPHDRIIVITDEQAQQDIIFKRVPDPVCSKAYMINVANNEHGVGYGKWTHIDGWSEGVIDYIRAHERIDEESAAKAVPETTPKAA